MGVSEVWYTRTESPIGVLTLVATPTGLAAISFGDDDGPSTISTTRIGPRVSERADRLDGVRRELDEYFAGRREEFDMPLDRASRPASSERPGGDRRIP